MLLKYQENSPWVIMPLIPMTSGVEWALILQGEIWCWSLLGLKGNALPIIHYSSVTSFHDLYQAVSFSVDFNSPW